MSRLLVLMGSGETTPTMVTPHQRILAAVGEGPRVVLDTPYGFQENADELSARTVEYFAHNVGFDVEVASLRDAASAGEIAFEVVAARVAEAAWVFAGPGSPSYLARQWLATSLPDVLRARLLDTARPTAAVFASAAACTVGRLAIPVYELYKVGEAPHWREGLDLLRPLGLDAIVVPHYDNTEGGTHDTSCCYIGERRLRILEAELDAGTWILGVDEHTAAVIDLETRELRVEGRGRVVLRVQGREHVVEAKDTITLDRVLEVVDELASARSAAQPGPTAAVRSGAQGGATAGGGGPEGGATAGGGEPEVGSATKDAFAQAVARGELLAAAEITAGVLAGAGIDGPDRSEAVAQVAALARIAQAGLHEHRHLVAPHVEALLALRLAARAERRFADADAIRDGLVAAGIEVRDGDGATLWEFTDPLTDAVGQLDAPHLAGPAEELEGSRIAT